MVEADPQPGGAEGAHHGRQQIAPRGRVGGLVVGQLGVPEAEPFVVLGGDDEVLHTRVRRRGRPGVGVVQVRVEMAEVHVVGFVGDLLVIVQVRVEMAEVHVVGFVGDLLVMLDPFMAGRKGIEPPMYEQAESVMDEPVGIARRR